MMELRADTTSLPDTVSKIISSLAVSFVISELTFILGAVTIV